MIVVKIAAIPSEGGGKYLLFVCGVHRGILLSYRILAKVIVLRYLM